jgi:hypothetical protein
MPQLLEILIAVTGGVSAVASVVGMLWHKLQSARDAGRTEATVGGLKEEMARTRDAVEECRTADVCDGKMVALNSRIDSAHKRMDGLERRIEYFGPVQASS